MGTLIQAPERVDAAVGGLQAIAKPAKGDGLGSFLSGILPAVNQEIDKYQQENRARVTALGQNDKLNGMVREVTLLDRQAYKQGRDYQDAVNGQIALAKDFQDKVDAIDRLNPDPDALMKLSTEYNNATVDNITTSNLPTDMKEQLYTSQLKQNAVYTKMIDAKLKRITADNVAVTRMNSLAMLTKNVTRGEYTPEELLILTQAHRDSSADGMRLVDQEVSIEDIDAAFQEDVLAVFTHAMTSAAAGEDGAANIEFLDKLASTVELMEGVSLKTATALSKKYMDFKAEAIGINDTQLTREVNDFVTRMELNPESVSGEDFSVLYANIESIDNISPTGKTGLLSKLENAFVSRHKALSSGQKLYDARTLSVPDAQRMGVSGSTLIDEARTAYLQDFNGDNFQAGRKLINQFGEGSQYDSAGVQAGAELYARPFIGYVKMGAEGVADDRYTEHRASNFKVFSELYRNTMASNGSAAADLLSGIPDDLREPFITVMQSGGTLEDVRIEAQSPKANAISYANLDKARAGLTAKMFSVVGTPLGDLVKGRKSMSRYIAQNYMDGLDIAVSESNPYLIQRMKDSSNPEELSGYVQEFQLPSWGGRSPSITNHKTYQLLQQAKTRDGAPMDLKYTAQADNMFREKLAEEYGVNADDVIVKFNSTGEVATYSLYDTTKDDMFGLRDGKGSVKKHVPVDTVQLLDLARTVQAADAKRKTRPTVGQRKAQEAATTIGRGTVFNQTTGQPEKINITVPYAKSTGDNADVAIDVVGFLADNYGFYSTPVNTVDGMVYGLGATDAMVHKDLRTEFIAAGKSGKVQDAIDVQAKLLGARLRAVNMNQAFQRVGAKAPTNKPYRNTQLPTARLLYTAAYLDGNAGLYGTNKGVKGVVAAMSAPTYSEGVKLFKKSKLYDTTGAQSKRNAGYLDQLKQHYKSQGKK